MIRDDKQKNVFVCQMGRENGTDSSIFRNYCRKVSASMEAMLMECGSDMYPTNQRQRIGQQDYYLLYFLSSGEGTVSFSDSSIPIRTGEFFILSPHQKATLGAVSEACIVWWIGFSGYRASGLIRKILQANKQNVWRSEGTEIPQRLAELIEMSQRSEAEDIIEYRMIGGLWNLLAELFRQCQTTDSRDERNRQDIVKYVKREIDNSYNEGLTISALSSKIGISRSYLYEVFSKDMGLSPKTYLDNVRMSKAIELLNLQEACSDEMIALMAGYPDSRVFIRKFKENYAMTPTEYRKKKAKSWIIEKSQPFSENIVFDFPNDADKPVYPTTLTEQLEALKNDPALSHFAACRAEAKRDRLTPLYHFSNPNGGLNDPNGPCFWQGRWHLFYQHIMPLPKGDRTIYWGHAVSRDLIHWTDLPDAIYPNPEKECWSGSTWVEDDKVTALYYGFRGHGGLMCATSADPLLLNWNKLYPDPVIPGQVGQGEDKPYDIYDPCIWKQGEYYYALTGCHKPNPVTGHWMRVEYLFRSKNCLDWEYRHPFIKEDWFSEINDDGACPYFVPFGDKHLLMHFSHARGPEFLVGRYDTENECFVPAFGKRFNLYKCSGLHAPALVADGQGGAYLFCVIPGGHMSLPYHLTLGGNGDELHVSPPEGIVSLRRNHIRKENIAMPANQEVVIEGVGGNCIEIVARFAPSFVSVIEMKVLRSPDAEEYTKITFYRNRGAWINWDNPLSILALDCEHTSLNPPTDHSLLYVSAPDTEEFRIEPDEGLELHIFLDKSLIDVFANDRVCIGKRLFPSREDSIGLSVAAIGGDSSLVSLDVYEMDAINPSSPDGLL